VDKKKADITYLWLSCGYHDGEQQKRTPPCVSTASVLFCFFRMAQGLRGNGRYIKKKMLLGGPDEFLRPV